MPATSRTAEFREILKEKQNVQPEAKRRKLTPKRVADGQRDGQDLLGKEYLAEAYVIVCEQYLRRYTPRSNKRENRS